MSGHNKWSQIKHQKAAKDGKKSVQFSKLLALIAIAAKENPDPAFNPRLRSAIETARAAQVPKENIDRASARSSEAKDLKEISIEAYGPEGSAMIIDCITDSTNRTINEIKHLLDELGAKFAEEGSVRWAFERASPAEPWKAKFPQSISNEGKEALEKIVEEVEGRDDVHVMATNIL